MTVVWLGGFALLLQLCLSFGHVHVFSLTTPRVAATELTVGKSSIGGQERTPSGLPDDDYCSICAMIYHAAAGLLPAPPLIANPAEFSQVSHEFFIKRFSFSVSRRLLFNTRAPPLA